MDEKSYISRLFENVLVIQEKDKKKKYLQDFLTQGKNFTPFCCFRLWFVGVGGGYATEATGSKVVKETRVSSLPSTKIYQHNDKHTNSEDNLQVSLGFQGTTKYNELCPVPI